MKNKFHFWITTILLSILIAVVLSPNTLYAQGRNLQREVFVYILKDSIRFPTEVHDEVPLDYIKIPSKALKNGLGQIRAKTIAKAFPYAIDNDTIRVRKDGVKVKIPQVSRIFRITLSKNEDVDIAIKILSKLPSILFAEGHSKMKLSVYDSLYSDQWHLNNTGQTEGTIDADIDAPEAWTLFLGSSTVKLGIIDSGVEIDHDDLSGKSYGDLPESHPYDDYAHGTHVAGIAAAKHGGGGVRGVDANVQVISKKVFSGYYFDGRDKASWAGNDIAYNKIVDAIDAGAHVLNHSYGSYDYSLILKIAFVYAYKMNRVSVAAMGNDYTSDPIYPANFGQGIIAVGATNDNDIRRSSSNTGDHIDVAAPGEDILSTWRDNKYNRISGTSMAAPIVSGIATLLKGYNSNLYNDDIEQIIRLSTEDVNAPDNPGWDEQLGTGRVNAKYALDLIRSPNEVKQWTANGGSSVGNTGTYGMTFFSTPGLADGMYIVKRYDVQKSVTFPNTFDSAPHVWGRGVSTIGYSGANPNYGMGWCTVVPGSVTSTGATLQTYVYEVWNIAGQYLGYYPDSPSNVTFAYTALGEPALPPPLLVTISGPTLLDLYEVGTFTADPDGGSGNYTNYRWWKRNDDGGFLPKSGGIDDGGITPNAPPPGVWNELTGWEGYQTIQQSSSYSFSLKVRVYDSSGGEAEDIHSVSISGGGGPLPRSNAGILPDTYALAQNYPNPFNPTTTIRYELPEASSVSIVIYDLGGREIVRWTKENESAGYKQFYWDATNTDGKLVPAGVYVYQLTAQSRESDKVYTQSRKMVLMK